MKMLSQIAQGMQTVLTTIASSTALKTGFIRRQRKLSGANFVQTLVFGWMSNPSATLEELTQTAVACGLSITPQGLDLRFTPQASNFLASLLEKAVDTLIRAESVTVDILQRFNSVYLLDSTVIRLPDSLYEVWQGCGGSSPDTSSSIKLQVGWNMSCGTIIGPQLSDGKQQDKSSSLQKKKLPKGSLRIADLGYFSLPR